jgi:hypothetical protein
MSEERRPPIVSLSAAKAPTPSPATSDFDFRSIRFSASASIPSAASPSGSHPVHPWFARHTRAGLLRVGRHGRPDGSRLDAPPRVGQDRWLHRCTVRGTCWRECRPSMYGTCGMIAMARQHAVKRAYGPFASLRVTLYRDKAHCHPERSEGAITRLLSRCPHASLSGMPTVPGNLRTAPPLQYIPAPQVP